MLGTTLGAGCTHTAPLTSATPPADDPDVRVILMPLEIEMTELTVIGPEVEHQAWVETASKLVMKAMDEELRQRQATLVHYDPPPEGSDAAYRHDQLFKLHRVVASTILRHKYHPDHPLPSKYGTFDWTVGETARLLRGATEADYALFVTIDDSYASNGRKLLSLALSALYLFPFPPGSVQVAWASLVDLDSGDIVWFNRLVSHRGDLRSEAPARSSVSHLLRELPL